MFLKQFLLLFEVVISLKDFEYVLFQNCSSAICECFYAVSLLKRICLLLTDYVVSTTS